MSEILIYINKTNPCFVQTIKTHLPKLVPPQEQYLPKGSEDLKNVIFWVLFCSTQNNLHNTPQGVLLMLMKESHKKLIRRLKIIEGQVRGLQGMIEKETYCIDVITQTSAVKQALSNVEDVLLEEHLSHCVVNQIKSGNVKKPVGEILQVYRLKRK